MKSNHRAACESGQLGVNQVASSPNAASNDKAREFRMHDIYWLISTVINIYIFFLIGSVILSWLVAFNVINLSNQFVAAVYRMLNAITEPVLAPVRNMLPNLGGIDISPIVVWVGLMFIDRVAYTLLIGQSRPI